MPAVRHIAYRFYRFYRRLATPISLGCRILVVKNEQVLLVQHTYQKGWYLPGGAVDAGESLATAAVRELREECGVLATKQTFVGMFFSRHEGLSDHIALFVTREFQELLNHSRDPEIACVGFFPLGHLPEGASPATRRRVAELISQSPPPDVW